MAVQELDVVGAWPELQDKPLEQIIAQESWFEGELDDEANVVFLQVAGTWHRLYFDSGTLFWKPELDGPPQTSSPSDFPLVDLGKKHGLIGHTIVEYEGNTIERGSEVVLRFDDGTALALRNRFDATCILVTQAPPSP